MSRAHLARECVGVPETDDLRDQARSTSIGHSHAKSGAPRRRFDVDCGHEANRSLHARAPTDRAAMFVTVIHHIHEPEGFQAAEAKALGPASFARRADRATITRSVSASGKASRLTRCAMWLKARWEPGRTTSTTRCKSTDSHRSSGSQPTHRRPPKLSSAPERRRERDPRLGVSERSTVCIPVGELTALGAQSCRAMCCRRQVAGRRLADRAIWRVDRAPHAAGGRLRWLPLPGLHTVRSVFWWRAPLLW